MPKTCADHGNWHGEQIYFLHLWQSLVVITGFTTTIMCKHPDISMHSSMGDGEWSAELQHQGTRAQTLGIAGHKVCSFWLVCEYQASTSIASSADVCACLCEVIALLTCCDLSTGASHSGDGKSSSSSSSPSEGLSGSAPPVVSHSELNLR